MSDALREQIALLLDEVQKMSSEINEIRSMISMNLEKQVVQQSLSETNAEIAMVDAMGLDPISYLKDKRRKHRMATATSRKRPTQPRTGGSH